MMNTAVRKHLWLAVLLIGLALTALYANAGEVTATYLYYSAAVAALAAVIGGLWLHRPQYRAPWYLLAAGIAILITADLMWDNYATLFGEEVPYPSLADPLYIAGFGAAIVAFWFWTRRANQANYREDNLDAGIVSIGLAVIVWMFILGPRIGVSDLPISAQVLSVIYPILDLFLLTMLIRIAMRRGLTSYRALALFIAGTLSFGISDTLWGWGELTDTYATLAAVADAGWMLCYVFWGAAALDPTVMALERWGRVTARTEAYLSTRRAALLVGTALLVPITLIFQQFRDLSIDMLVFATGAAVLFALVVSRMHLIVRSLETAMETQTELQSSLEFAAFHDPLTGLANRTLLNASLESMVEQHREKSIALLFLDLDNFKDVNDRLGHAVGDRLLVQVAEQLGECVRPQDLIGRIGGDEFVILLRFEGEPPLDTSIAVSERILKLLDNFTEIDGEPIQIGASIGIAWLGNDHVSVDGILRAADHAMYDAKRAGKNRYSVATVTPDGEQLVGDSRRPTALRPVEPFVSSPAKVPYSA